MREQLNEALSDRDKFRTFYNGLSTKIKNKSKSRFLSQSIAPASLKMRSRKPLPFAAPISTTRTAPQTANVPCLHSYRESSREESYETRFDDIFEHTLDNMNTEQSQHLNPYVMESNIDQDMHYVSRNAPVTIQTGSSFVSSQVPKPPRIMLKTESLPITKLAN